MADDNDDVIVSLPGDTSEVRITKAADVKTSADETDPVADLKSQFAAMTSRVSAAENAAHTATQQLQETNQRLHHAETEVVSSQLDTVLSGIAAADAEAANAEAAIAAAFESGDGPALARAQRNLNTAVSRRERLVEAKDDLEDAVKRRPDPAQRRDVAPAPRTQPADPIERFTQGMSAKSAAFIRANPHTVTDKRTNARMLAAHAIALADDIPVDSDEYFERIAAGIKQEQQQKPREEQKPQGDGRRPSSAAASGSGTGGGLNGGTTEVRLTKGEALSATDGTLVWNYDDPSGQKRWAKGDPIGLAEMARRKHEGKKNGLYDKSVSE